MKNQKPITVEIVIYFLIFVLGLTFRVINLYHAPLSDQEAIIALQAKDLVSGFDSLQTLPDQPLLVNILGLGFLLFGVNTLSTRILPVLAGSIMILMPFLFRKTLGKKTAILLSLWLAIDPLFYFLSRKVNSTLISLILVFVIVKLVREKKWVWIGITAALGVLSGVQFILGLLLSYILYLILEKKIFVKKDAAEGNYPQEESHHLDNEKGEDFNWRMLLTGFVPAVLLVSSAVFFFPQQFGTIPSGLVNFILGFVQRSDVTLVTLISGILVYEPFVLIFGVIGMIYFWQSEETLFRLLKPWVFVAVLFILIYPFKTVSFLVWLILPFAIYSIKLIKKIMMGVEKFGVLFPVFSLVVFVFSIFLVLFSISGVTSGAEFLGVVINGQTLFFAALVIFILSILLIGWAWSWKLSRSSLVTALCVLWGIVSISSAWNLGGGRDPYYNELWKLGKISPEADILVESIDQMSRYNNKSTDEVTIYVSEINSPSLLWLLKDYRTEVGAGINQPGDIKIVITPEESNSQIQGFFSGQDFLINSDPAWNLMTFAEMKSWFLTRSAPQNGIVQESVVLWFNSTWFVTNQ